MQELFYAVVAVAMAMAAVTVFYLSYNISEAKALRKACDHCNSYLKELEAKNTKLKSQIERAETKSAMYYAVNRSLKETIDVIHTDHKTLVIKWSTVESAYHKLLEQLEQFTSEAEDLRELEKDNNQLSIFSQINNAIKTPME